jgi:DNA-directed RNA polymerase sigma subunit (sigma70/sigma32)
MGIAPETVRQIEIKALAKLKESAKDLKEYCFN